MVLSTEAVWLYAELGDGSYNLGSLQKRLNLNNALLEVAVDELIKGGYALVEGRRRIRRVSVDRGTTISGISGDATQVFDRLAPDGSGISGLRLRSAVRISNERYRAALTELKAAGLVQLGRGSVAFGPVTECRLTISSFEIKRAAEANRLQSVYEAEAHGRYAHFTSLVVEISEESDDLPLREDVLREIERRELGLFTMYNQGDGVFRVRILIPPSRKAPESFEMHNLLESFFSDDDTRLTEYRRAIGR